MAIHPTATIDKSAEIHPDAEIGPNCVIEPDVRIGAGCHLLAHVFVGGGTRLGERVQIHPFAVIGHHPQDRAWDGAPSYTEIGDDTIIRESVTVHRGTKPGSTTRIGKGVMMMVGAHIAHNCDVGDGVTMANYVLLAGHVRIGPRAFVSAYSGMHQFTRIGELAMVTGHARIVQDIPPFTLTGLETHVGLNVVGLRRAGATAAEREGIKRLYKAVFLRSGSFADRLREAEASIESDWGRRFVDFLKAPSKRGIAGRSKRRDAETSDADVAVVGADD